MKWETQVDSALWSMLQEWLLKKRQIIVGIGQKCQKKWANGKGPHDSIEQPLIELSVPVGQLQQWLNITEEVMDMVGTTEV